MEQQKLKILVMGSTGMAGHTITLYFLERGYDVTAYSTTAFPYCKNIISDALDKDALKEILLNGKYDAVINCIGLLNQVAENNKSLAVYLNSYLPHFIVDTLKDKKTKYIHMSTDCVFAGNGGPYFEKSLRDGLTFYDRTKALGEVDDDKNLTFRNSIIGPDLNENGIGLFNWFMKQKDETKGYTGAIWTGVTTLTLAKAMEVAIQDDLSGIYNLVNNESISKYDLCILFNKYFNNDKLIIKKDNKLKLDKSLRSTRNDFSYMVPSYEEMIIEMKEWINSHSELYPHYKKGDN